jgi:hypothetical protein
MKKLLTIIAMFFASPALAIDHLDIVSAMYSQEDGKPVRIQHVMRHKLGTDWLNLRGISNVDLDSDGNWQRIQIKPRLLVRPFRFDNGFSLHAVNQFEYFETRRFDRKSNRVGAGIGYNRKTLSIEVNYLAHDSFNGEARWDTYVNYRFGKWGFNNVLWYVPENNKRFWQPGLSYSFTRHFRVQAQYLMLRDHYDAALVGIAWRF